MSKAGNGLIQTESDVLADVISGQSCHAVLISSPPNYVKQISKYLESSGKLNGGSEAPNEANSDSGDSLFLTQKPAPEAVRPKRRRPTQSTLLSHRGDLTENDTSSSSSDGESTTDKNKKKVVYRLPKFVFPFLHEKTCLQKKILSAHRNKKLHNFAMGGFFKCVEEQQECRQKRHLKASLPTIDREGEYICPISEPEEERTEAEDIQVVERKRFVVSLKAKSFQPWYEPRETCSEDKRQAEEALNSESESQRQRLKKGGVRRLLSSCTKSCGDGDSSHGRMNLAGDTSRIQTETAERSLKRMKKKLSLIQNVNATQLCDDSDATVCDTDADKHIGTNTEPECEHEDPDLLQKDTADDALCESIKKKKKKQRKKPKGVEEVNDLSLEEAEGQKVAEFVKITEEENSSLPRDKSESVDLNQNTQKVKYADHKTEPGVNVVKSKKKKKKQERIDEQVEQLQTAAEPQTDNEKAEKQTPDRVSDQTTAGPSDDLQGSSPLEALESSGKRKKHKKKKRRSVFNDTQVEDSWKDLDFSNDLSSAENIGLSVKKKTEKIHDSCSPEAQTMTEQAVTNKKKTREKLSHDTNVQRESAQKKDENRASSFHQQEQAGPDDSAEQPAGRTSDVTAKSAEITARLEEHDTGRKRKKRSAVQPSADGGSEEPQETCQSSPSAVTKKKRKLTESAADAEPSQTHQTEVPWKKKKKKKKKKKRSQHSNVWKYRDEFVV